MFNRFHLILILIFLQIYTIVVHAQDINWTADQKILTGGSGSNIRPRILALDPQHGIIVWGNDRSQSIHYALWEGDSLAGIQNINMKQSKAFITSWASTEIAGRNQVVYIIYKEDPAETGKIYLVRSMDFGKNFSDPIPVVIPNGFYSRFPGIAIDKDLQPIVSYMRFKTDWSQPEYVSIRSKDFGDSFDAFTEVTDKLKGEACDCCPVSMETEGDKIVVFYRNNRNNIRNMTASISTNNGISYDITQELDTADWFLQSCPSTGGDGFFNGDQLHSVWSSGRTGISKVFYSKYNLLSNKIEGLQIMNHTQGRNFQQNYPRMAGKNDTIGIVWNELVNTMDIFFSYFLGNNSSDLITHTIRINKDINGTQTTPDIAYHSGNFYLCWQDQNDNSIRFKKGSLNIISSNDSEFAQTLKMLNTKQGVEIRSEKQIDECIIYNLEGRIIAKYKKFNTVEIVLPSAGIYILKFQQGKSEFSMKWMKE
ncbi:MAG: T9SS type A sorting domain-containing protein [Saprospiraceae bacterium]|nr:T9SS type A sorting domain-containing protein [Saprospiraceae bacterium]MBK8298399.1 T9SS type A sorting domain-containing protein [Saprospiraceae bacterium]